MLDWLTSAVSGIAGWLNDHPAGVAWLLGWVAALGASQTAKQLLFPTTWTADRAKRVSQSIAIVAGGAVAWALWPNGTHRLLLALIVGMSAPTAYTFIKACIEARFPDLADALSWQGIKRGDEPHHDHEDNES